MTEITLPNTQGTLSNLTDGISTLSRRSSSQTSHASSSGSKKARTMRGSKQPDSKASSTSENQEDPSLTSFPSFSPDPNEIKTTSPEETQKPERTVSQKLRDRKSTLAGLTNASPPSDQHSSLFGDTPRSSLDIPGSLHLASDEHIQRMIAKTGAVGLIRQYARDLAQRDAEISTLRVRADNRERELKRLLRDAQVPSAEVEKRLLRLEHGFTSRPESEANSGSQRSKSGLSLDKMMTEAMAEMQSSTTNDQVVPEANPSIVIQQQKVATNPTYKVRESTTSSQTSSRASSFASQTSQDADATVRPRQVSSNVNKLNSLQNIFQPPGNTTSYFIGGTNKTVKRPKAVDELSVRSNQSNKSVTSWTRFFGARPPQTRARASSLDQSVAPDIADLEDSTTPLTRSRTPIASNPSKSKQSATLVASRPQAKRTNTVTRISTNPNHTRKESNASSQPPTVELDSMIESSQLPPSMSSRSTEGVLTDRFGFIYDRKRKRQQLKISQHRSKPSASESLASTRSGEISPIVDHNRPDTPISMDDDSVKKSWQDYLMPSSGVGRGRPKELLVHTPSAGAVVTVSTADAEGTLTPPRYRDVSISVSSTMQKALPSASSVSEPQSSTVTATSVDFTHDSEDEVTDVGASRALLDQLTEVHDNLQAERTVKWNDFLRRVRSERTNIVTDRAINNAPEADLVNGELIGIATLGRSSKTKGKYLHFKSLVLSGIPVSLRPKIWAECSGATSLRIPGYYEDLVARSEEGTEIDREIASQITADVKRTLRDNIFFHLPDAPGVQRLEELLRAYSLHNPRIGYCQGMNLITASLLLICATSEDCFWLLVAIIDHILPSGYFDQNLLVARADQIVLRQYVSEVLPKLDFKLQELGVDLEACTFHWFLSLYTGVLTGGEALYRIWDVVLCLNSSDSAPITLLPKSAVTALGVDNYLNSVSSSIVQPPTPTTPSDPSTTTVSSSTDPTPSNGEHDGTCSSFLFQLSLALLKLNEDAILALDSPAMVYTYLNHNMTAHNITIDALVNASEMLRGRVKRVEVLAKRKKAIESLS